jgi:hypothetical protein
MPTTALDVITMAMQEANITAAGETLSADDAAFGLRKLNRLLDSANAERLNIFTVNFANYMLIPNHAPHTIGPTGNSPTPNFICVGTRPTKIVGASLIINTSTPNYTIPLNIQDADWWQAQRVQGLATSYPTDLYYEPDWPNGSCFFWPVPTTAWPVQLETWTNLLALPTLQTTFTLPPGYEDAITYTLAETLEPAFGKAPNPMLSGLALKARARIKSLNAQSPRISTGGDGLPSSGKARSSFQWRTGGF